MVCIAGFPYQFSWSFLSANFPFVDEMTSSHKLPTCSTFIFPSVSISLYSPFGDGESRISRRRAGIDGDLEQNFFDFVFGYAGVARRANMSANSSCFPNEASIAIVSMLRVFLSSPGRAHTAAQACSVT